MLQRTALVLLASVTLVGAAPVYAQGLVPEDFFNQPVNPAAPTAVEAQTLTFNNVSNVITATGDVVVRADGYVLTGDNLHYDRASGAMRMVGNTSITDPSGNVSRQPSITMTGGLKKAVLDSLTITAYDGSQITADSADYDQAVQTIMVNAKYQPCGECIDAKGRKIGWSLNAAKVTKNDVDGSIAFEQPYLSILGMPVAWLPYLWLPNMDMDWLPQPTFAYTDTRGAELNVDFKAYSSPTTDILLSPRLMSRQGFLMGAEWIQRFDKGSMSIKASGLYQLDPKAFTFTPAQREWRGALQTSGEFVPVDQWTVGFAYAVQTDNAYYKDYAIAPRRAAVNEVYATHLSEDSFVDARLQQYNVLGDNLEQATQQQGMALPNLRLERSFDVPNDGGRLTVEGRMLNIYREVDYQTSANGVPYDYGFAGTRLHGMGQVSWQKQLIFGGAVATPFLGVRVDGAQYNGRSTAVDGKGVRVAPNEQSLFDLTPIAAIDVRYPLVSYNPGVTHLVEPIVQLVYRGGSASQPGITNEDSQSITLDDSTLFAYNRFTGIDKQERGLRANIGGRYMATLDNGNYFEVVAGQSFHLAGQNVFAEANRQQVGVGSGLEYDASYGVLGAYAKLFDRVKLAGKLQIDSSDFHVARAGLGLGYTGDGWSGAVNYRYAEAVPEAGNVLAMHEIGAEVSMPIDDYWSVSSNAYWDMTTNSLLQVGGGLTYDDGFVRLGGSVTRYGKAHTTEEGLAATATIRLRSPAGLDLGYSGAVPVPRL